MEENIVCVIATDKKLNIKACTSCDRETANKYAKYYRSKGYISRIVTCEDLKKDLPLYDLLAKRCKQHGVSDEMCEHIRERGKKKEEQNNK